MSPFRVGFGYFKLNVHVLSPNVGEPEFRSLEKFRGEIETGCTGLHRAAQVRHKK